MQATASTAILRERAAARQAASSLRTSRSAASLLGRPSTLAGAGRSSVLLPWGTAPVARNLQVNSVGLALGEYTVSDPSLSQKRQSQAQKPAQAWGSADERKSPDLNPLFSELGDMIHESRQRLLPPKHVEATEEAAVVKKKRKKPKLAMTASIRVAQRIKFYQEEPEEQELLPNVPCLEYKVGLQDAGDQLPDVSSIQSSCRQLSTRTVTVKDLLEEVVSVERYHSMQSGRERPAPNFVLANRQPESVMLGAMRTAPPELFGGSRCNPFAPLFTEHEEDVYRRKKAHVAEVRRKRVHDLEIKGMLRQGPGDEVEAKCRKAWAVQLAVFQFPEVLAKCLDDAAQEADGTFLTTVAAKIDLRKIPLRSNTMKMQLAKQITMVARAKWDVLWIIIRVLCKGLRIRSKHQAADMIRTMLQTQDQSDTLRRTAHHVLQITKMLVGEIRKFWSVRDARLAGLELHFQAVEDRMLSTEHNKRTEAALKEQRMIKEKTALTKQEKEEVQRTLKEFETNARTGEFAISWQQNRTGADFRRQRLGRHYTHTCKAYSEKIWVWRATVKMIIAAAKDLKAFIGQQATNEIRCPPEPDRHFWMLTDRQMAKFVQHLHQERDRIAREGDRPMSPLAEEDAWIPEDPPPPPVVIAEAGEILDQPLVFAPEKKDRNPGAAIGAIDAEQGERTFEKK